MLNDEREKLHDHLSIVEVCTWGVLRLSAAFLVLIAAGKILGL